MDVDYEEDGLEEEKKEEKEDDEVREAGFLLRLLNGKVLTGKVNNSGHSEWDWSRVTNALDMKTAKDHVFLKRGKDEFQDEFRLAQVSFEEFHYRGQDIQGECGVHTMESRALWLMLCLLPLRKQVRANVKQKAVGLVKMLIDAMLAAGSGNASLLLQGTIFGTDFQYHSKQVCFSSLGTTTDIAELFDCHSKASAMWARLSSKDWCGHKITSSLENVTLFDFVLFLMYAKSHQQGIASEIWRDIGCFLWPMVLFMLGDALEECSKVLQAKDAEPAPLLKTKTGGTKRVPFINKLLLLRKLKKNKVHRRLVMSSHSDLVPSNTQLVRNEALLETAEYLKLLDATFSNCSWVQVSWDPSTYAGDEVLVATVFSAQCGVAGYLPIQFLHPVAASELEEELRVLAGKKTLTRVAGYAELRALSHALAGIKKSLGDFKLPDNLLWKALGHDEHRELVGGKYFVVKTSTGERAPQFPEAFNIHNQGLLVSVTDQGRVNLGVLDYIVYHVGLAVLVAFDRQHRTYNDLKSSLRAAGLFKTFLAYAMIFNLNYSPMGSKTWFLKKQGCLKAFVEENSPLIPVAR